MELRHTERKLVPSVFRQPSRKAFHHFQRSFASNRRVDEIDTTLLEARRYWMFDARHWIDKKIFLIDPASRDQRPASRVK